MDKNEEQFINRMRQLRKSRGWSQTKLAVMADMPEEKVMNLEAPCRRASYVRLGEAIRICEVFGVDLNAMTGSEPLVVTSSWTVK